MFCTCCNLGDSISLDWCMPMVYGELFTLDAFLLTSLLSRGLNMISRFRLMIFLNIIIFEDQLLIVLS